MSVTGMTDEEMEQAVREIEGRPSFPCPDCEFVGSNRAGLAQHIRHRHPEKAPRRPAASSSTRTAPAPSELVVETVVGKAVGNLQVLGGYLAVVLPHTGIAIAGVPGEREGDPPVVASRAMMAGSVLAKWAQRDARVLQAMDRFNKLFETSEVVELAAGIGAAVAVDVGAVPADLAIDVGPFQGANAIRPVHAVIGDVVDYVAAVRQAETEARAQRAPDGVAQDGAAIVTGGMEET